MLLGRLLHLVVSPRFKRLGAGLPGLLGSCFWSYCSVGFRLRQLPLPLLLFTSCACLVFLENFGFVGVDGGFSSGFLAGVRLWAFSLLGFQLDTFYPSG